MMIKTGPGRTWTCSTEDKEFYEAAREYCRFKKFHLRIQRRMAKLECEDPGTFMDRENGYMYSTCWAAYKDRCADRDLMCECCQRHQKLYEERIKVGKMLPNLAKRMYEASRRL